MEKGKHDNSSESNYVGLSNALEKSKIGAEVRRGEHFSHLYLILPRIQAYSTTRLS